MEIHWGNSYKNKDNFLDVDVDYNGNITSLKYWFSVEVCREYNLLHYHRKFNTLLFKNSNPIHVFVLKTNLTGRSRYQKESS